VAFLDLDLMRSTSRAQLYTDLRDACQLNRILAYYLCSFKLEDLLQLNVTTNIFKFSCRARWENDRFRRPNMI